MPLFCGVSGTDVSILWCFGHRCHHFVVFQTPMHLFCGVSGTDTSILWCFGHRYLHFVVFRVPMSPFCGVSGTDASILWCFGHRWLHFIVFQILIPSFCGLLHLAESQHRRFPDELHLKHDLIVPHVPFPGHNDLVAWAPTTVHPSSTHREYSSGQFRDASPTSLTKIGEDEKCE